MSQYIPEGMMDMNAAGQELMRVGCGLQYYYYNYNQCVGTYCAHNSNCASGCCYLNYCDTECHVALEWLWWTLGMLFLCMCICAMVGARQRRRRMMMMAAANRNHGHCNSDADVVVVQTHYTQPQVGQPVPAYAQQQPGYQQVPQQQPMYGQQQPMYGQPQPQAQQQYYPTMQDPSLIDPPPQKTV